jgi:hypothetical protein
VGHEFDAATAVTRIDAPTGAAPAAAGSGDGSGFGGRLTYAAEVFDGWDIGGVANGGYLLAIAGRAVADATGRPPLTVTAHYLHPGLPGPAQVTVDPVKTGKRLATVTASLGQGDRELIRVLATCGSPSEEPPVLVDGAPPELPPYDECDAEDSSSDPGAPPAMGELMPPPGLMERLATRIRPGDDAFRYGGSTGRAEIAGWFAFRDERPIDALALLLAADAFAPPIFNVGVGPGWVPTIELTVHVRGVPAPGPLRGVFRSHYITAGLLSEDGELWDTSGQLVAQSRQLALTPRV